MRRAQALALAGLLGACAKGDPSGPLAGKAYFFQAGCASCHKIGDEGSAVGPDLTLAGFRHSSEWLDLWLKDPQAWKPGTLMPNTRVPDAARLAIVGYLAGLKGQDWPKGARPWDDSALKDPVARGRVLFARAGCSGCHGSAGAGGQPNNNVKGELIPALDGVFETFTKAELVQKIRRGVAAPQRADPAGPAPLVRMPAWGELLDEAELDAVASYLLSLRPAKADAAGF
jgi:mono/diheme cytochrome c family protein